MNCNKTAKAYQKYKYVMTNNRYYEEVETMKKWNLLESQSRVSIFCNTGLLKTVQKADYPMFLKINTGSAKFNQQGYLEGYVWVWFFE